jgi:cytochrome P450
MDDSPGQVPVKAALGAALAQAAGAAPGFADRWARRLLEQGASYDELAFRLPAATLGQLLGLPLDPVELAEPVGALARCFAPGCRPEDAAAGAKAAGELAEICGRALDGAVGDHGSPLLAELVRRLPGRREAIVANTVGLFTQAYEATAGLLAGTLLAAMRDPEVRRSLRAGPAAAAAAVAEVARRDPPVQNTRRFTAEPLALLGRELAAGSTILALLAAASRDPRASAPAGSSWGHGRHTCPGSTLATIIAAAAAALLAEADAIDASPPPFTYHPSLNTRIPLFGAARPRRTS